MLSIPGINEEMVELYGKHFFKLISNAKAFYYSMQVSNEDSSGEFEDKPVDPNHVNVIDISSDEEEDPEPEAFSQGSHSSMEERSTYFRVDPEVAAFNSRSKLNIHPRSLPLLMT